MPKTTNSKLEFSQKIVLIAFIFSIIVVLLSIGLNYVLLWNGRQGMTDETVAAITTYGGITSGLAFTAYAALNAIRSWSRNKHGNGENGNNTTAKQPIAARKPATRKVPTKKGDE